MLMNAWDMVTFFVCGGLFVTPFAVKFGIEIGRLREQDARAAAGLAEDGGR